MLRALMALSKVERWALTLVCVILITALTRWPMFLIHEAFTLRDLHTEVELEKRDANERLSSTLCADEGSYLYERHHCSIDKRLVDEWTGWRVMRKYGFRRHLCNEINCESLYWVLYAFVLLTIPWLFFRAVKGVSTMQQTTLLPSSYYSAEQLAHAAAVVRQELAGKDLSYLDEAEKKRCVDVMMTANGDEYDPDVIAFYNKPVAKNPHASPASRGGHSAPSRRAATVF